MRPPESRGAKILLIEVRPVRESGLPKEREKEMKFWKVGVILVCGLLVGISLAIVIDTHDARRRAYHGQEHPLDRWAREAKAHHKGEFKDEAHLLPPNLFGGPLRGL